jgi:hypothetical protein
MSDNVIKLAPSGAPSEAKPRHLGNWFRVYQSILDDPKVRQLSAKNFRALINLWAFASQNHGALPSENDIAFKLRLSRMRRRRFWPTSSLRV